MAQARSQLNILLKSLIALEKSLPSALSERWVHQGRNAAAIRRRMSVLSLLAQELLFQPTPSSSIPSASSPSSASLLSSSVPPSVPLPSSPSSLLSSSPSPLPSSSSPLPSSSSSWLATAAVASSPSLTPSPPPPLSVDATVASCLPSPSSLPLRPLPSRSSMLLSTVLLCFRELKHTIEKLKMLIKSFEGKSSIWQVLEHEALAYALHKLNHDMANALDILPLHLLNVSDEIKEQTHLIYCHLRRSQKPLINPTISALRDQILALIHEDLEKIDIINMQDIFTCLHLRTFEDCAREVQLLISEMNMQAGTGGIPVVCTIKKLIALVKHAQCLLYGSTDAIRMDSPPLSCSAYPEDLSMSSISALALSEAPVFPDEFRCPISLDLMQDPVVIATGHTYDRTSISKWIDSGHLTCPKSGQRLLHVIFIPNCVLRRMIHEWCNENGIPYDTAEGCTNHEEDEDHISLRQAALETTKDTVAYLVGKLATGSLEVQRQVAYELRLLTKCGIENRIYVAEAGAIPFLVPLLTSSDQKTQENAVTALLNLSICENNKSLIMAVGALDAVVDVVREGVTMEARENAAATLYSLSVVDDYKKAIGAKPGAIQALLTLLREGSSLGKKDAARALLNLCMFMGNKAKVVDAGAIAVLVDLLSDERAFITDNSMAVLAVLAEYASGCAAILDQARAIPMFVDLLRLGSAKGKEHAVAVLLALCKNGGANMVSLVSSINTAVPSLENIVELGSARAKRRASSLLTLLCRHPHESNPQL